MEDYYKLLDIDEKLGCEEIARNLRELNRRYRRRTNSRDAKIVQEATDKLNQINQAMVHFSNDKARKLYDADLAGYRAEQELKQPLADVNLYRVFRLSADATTTDIQQALEAVEELTAGQSEHDDVFEREKSLIALARRILLDADRRKDYDLQLQEKLAFEKEREAQKLVPLQVGDIEVYDWLSLESALEAHPHQGLFLLQDGELEAWLRWSLSRHQNANWVQEIAERAGRSQTPFMDFEELLRLVNGNRPFVIYAQGEGPDRSPIVAVRHASEIPVIADSHWSLFTTQFEYLYNWVAFYGNGEAAQKWSQFPYSENIDIQLERLLYCLDETLPPPSLKLTGDIEEQKVDFGTIRKWDAPTKTVQINHVGRGYLYGQISTSDRWITVDSKTFEGTKTAFEIGLTKEHLQAGAENRGDILLRPLDSRVPPVEIQVVVTQHTGWGSVKSLFGKK